jgi:hypothetical protein
MPGNRRGDRVDPWPGPVPAARGPFVGGILHDDAGQPSERAAIRKNADQLGGAAQLAAQRSEGAQRRNHAPLAFGHLVVREQLADWSIQAGGELTMAELKPPAKISESAQGRRRIGLGKDGSQAGGQRRPLGARNHPKGIGYEVFAATLPARPREHRGEGRQYPIEPV